MNSMFEEASHIVGAGTLRTILRITIPFCCQRSWWCCCLA